MNRGHFNLTAAPVIGRRFLLHNFELVLEFLWIMGTNLHVESVFEWCDDSSATGVILGIRARDNHDVEGQANFVALDLNVFFFHEVEQTDLDLLRQIGKLVDRENTPVGTRHQAVVNGFLVGQIASFGHLDRVDLPHEIRDRYVRRGELFPVAMITIDPLQR
jgi:hypothetical protein